MSCEAKELKEALLNSYGGKLPKDVQEFVNLLENTFPSAFEGEADVKEEIDTKANKKAARALLAKMNAGKPKEKVSPPKTEVEVEQEEVIDAEANKKAARALLAKRGTKKPKLSVRYENNLGRISKTDAKTIVSNLSPSAAKLVKEGKVQFINSNELNDLLSFSSGDINLGTRTREELLENYKFSIVGANARNSRNNNLRKAKEELARGVKTSEEIRRETGWWLGLDGKMRYMLKTTPTLVSSTLKEGKYKLVDLIKYDELFEEYPYLRNLPVVVTRDSYDLQLGVYSPIDGITVNLTRLEDVGGVDRLLEEEDIQEAVTALLLNTLGHETQHSIQFTEAFAGGANIDTVDNKMVEELKLKYTVLFDALNKLKDENKNMYDSLVHLYSKPGKVSEKTGIINSDLGKALVGYLNSSAGKDSKYLDMIGDRLSIMLNGMYDLDANSVERWSTFEAYLESYGEEEARAVGEYWSGMPSEYSGLNGKGFLSESTQRNLDMHLVHAIQGVYIKKDNNMIGTSADSKTSYINVDTVTKDTIVGVFMHEVGVHAVVDMLKNRNKNEAVGVLLDKAVDLLDRGRNSTNSKVREFFEKVDDRLSKSKNSGSREETLAYIVEEAFNTVKVDEGFIFGETITDSLNRLNKVSPVLTALLKELLELVRKSIDKFVPNLNKFKGFHKELDNVVNDVTIAMDLEELVSIVKLGVDALAANSNITGADLSSDKAMVTLYNKIMNKQLCE